MRKLLFAAAAMLLVCVSAHAQWAVIDSANLNQNIENTLSTLEQEFTAAEELFNQYKQLENEAKQLASLGSGATSGLLSTVQSAMNAERQYSGAVKSLYGDVSNAKSVSDNVYGRMAASGLSPEEWIQREAQANSEAKQGVGYLSDYQASVLEQVNTRYKEVSDLQGKISETTGIHQSMQLMNAQMNSLLSITNQILEQNAIMGQYMTRKDAVELGKADAETSDSKRWLESKKEDRAKTLSRIGEIGNNN